MDAYGWYSQLIRPFWAPPAWLFGPVWTALYAVIAVSYGYVAILFIRGRAPLPVFVPFALNLAFNLAFTPLQFGLRSNVLAAFDIVLVLATLIWALVTIYPRARWVSYVNVPHLIWVCFATALQLTITWLNL